MRNQGLRVALVRRGDIGSVDGVSRFTFTLARGFKDLGNEVYIVAGAASRDPRKYFGADVEVIALSSGSSSQLKLAIRHLVEGSKVLKDLGANLIVANGAIPLISKAIKISVNHGNATIEYGMCFQLNFKQR